MRVKICGITNLDDARAAAACGADFVGLILAPSARRVTVDEAAWIAAALPAETQPVLVFRDAGLDEVVAAIRATGCRWVQLHGREPVAYLAELRARAVGPVCNRSPEVQIIRAWEVGARADGDVLLAYLAEAEAAHASSAVVLLDVPKRGGHPGFACLADIAARIGTRPPQVWCAGGLTPDNVAEAVRQGGFDGVDVASGVESRPGVKDHAAVRRFVGVAKGRSP